MKTITKTILGVLLMGSFTCANADVLQVWECTLHDGKTAADVLKVSSAWLAAAKGMKGGADLKVYHDFPMVANAGEGTFEFILAAPNVETWGAFMGGYPGSAAARADAEWNATASCSGNTLWESVEVK
jgi:hypothetical protein